MELTAGAEPLFNKTQLKALILPLVIEQLLAVTVGMADTIMITSVGEAAISGISLVDNISFLMIQLLSALCTGGAVIVSQYLGRKDGKNARHSAKQLVFAVGVLGLILMTIALVFNKQLLQLIFGNIDADVMLNAQKYFIISACSYPGLAIYNACAALFRSMGNSKVSMFCSMIMNVINIGGNAILIYGFKWGVEGAAVPTLAARTTAAVVMLILISNPANTVFVRNLHKVRPDWKAIKMVMKIGLPNGVENSVFQVGKLMVQRVVTSFGTPAIAANAIVGSVTGVMMVPGAAIGLSLITVVGQCVGAGEIEQMKQYVKKLMAMIFICVAALGLIMFFVSGPMLPLFNLSDEAIEIAGSLCRTYAITYPIFWPLAFPFVNVLRAAGDVKFTMVASLITMWCCRIALSYVFAYGMNLGVYGVWFAMYADWLVRSVVFTLRYRSGAWKKHKVLG